MEAGSSSDVPPFPINPTWLLSKEALMKIPSILDGIDPMAELKQRQQAGAFMQEMGEMLINGVKEHRDVAAACLFLAGKSEEFPRKLELISKAWYKLKHRNEERPRPFDQKVCEESGEFIVFLEGVVLQTIGFKLDVQLPHPLIVRYTQKYLREKVNLNETAYFFATDMIFITNWSVRYRITTLACVCIHLTCLWAEHEIVQPPGATPWFKEIDSELSKEVLDVLVEKFTQIYETIDQSQLVSRKRMAERQSRFIANSSKYVARPPGQSTSSASSSHKSSSHHGHHSSGGNHINKNNVTADGSSMLPLPSQSAHAQVAPSERLERVEPKLGVLPPPPVPPQLSHIKWESDSRPYSRHKHKHVDINARHEYTGSKHSGIKREYTEEPSDDNRPPEALKQRKLTVKEYRERNASSASTSSSRMQNGAPPMANSWMSGA